MKIYVVKREDEIIEHFSSPEKANIYISCMGEVDTDSHELSVEEVELDNWEPLSEYSYDVHCRLMKTGEKVVSAETNLNMTYKIPIVKQWGGNHPDFTGCIINLSAKYIDEAEEIAKPLFEDYLKTLREKNV